MLAHHSVRFVAIAEWPAEQRARFHRSSPFRANYSDTCRLLDRELTALKAKRVLIQLDCDEREIRQDGMPRSDARVRTPAVILSFESKYGPLSYPCDTYATWKDNLRAIALGLEALRKVDRYGVTKTGQQYKGWKAITYRGDDQFTNPQQAAEFLARLDAVTVPADALLRQPDLLKAAWSAIKQTYHPDVRPDMDTLGFSRITGAYEIVRGYHARRTAEGDTNRNC